MTPTDGAARRGGPGGIGERTIWINGKFLAQEVTGTQRYALELTRRLLQRHPGRFLLAVPQDAWLPDDIDVAVVRRLPATGQIFEQLVLPWTARRDALLSLGGPAPLLGRRQVVTMHDMSVFRFPQTYSGAFARWYRLMYRSLARRAELVVTVSDFSAREIRSVLGRGPGQPRVVVVPNGADHVPLQALPDGAAECSGALGCLDDFVLCVGTFARHKNLAPVLDVLERRGISSVVVGARGDTKVFAAASTERWTHATFTGRIDDSELTALYGRARALVFPSLYEGFGIPVVEAQRLGCPVVAVAAASIPEVAGEGAVLCDPMDVDQIGDAVEWLASDTRAREALVNRGRRNVERFRWSVSVARLEAALGLQGASP